MKTFQHQYQIYADCFETALHSFCAKMCYRPSVLAESMRYSLLSGGKRVRPVLFFAALDLFGEDYGKEMGFALALECIHTYSLIHDDLPAMDNDDYRRGTLSNHKVYGEANAILAGDALLSEAFSLLLRESARGIKYNAAAQYLGEAAGANGMVAGQSADILYEKKAAGEKELFFIYENKTAKLCQAPVVMAAILAERDVRQAESFGKHLGILFQLTDDILDAKGESGKMGKTLGKDAEEDKLTCVKIFGMEKSDKIADEYAQMCYDDLRQMGGNDFFVNLVRFVRERDI